MDTAKTHENEIKPKSRKGFASLSPERRKEIASMGGRRAQELGVAHRYTKEEASAAGKKGGKKISQNKAHMAAIGSKGGRKSKNANKVSDEK